MSFDGEEKYIADKEIKYVFQKSNNSPYLLVVFSAFNPVGTKPTYNYIRTLQSYDINKLFILDDYGDRGCYYLGNNRIFDVESSVASLISWIAVENDILKHNIITCGTSKGGYTALYYGIKYGFGRVIAGAPQTFLGSYLNGANELPTLEFISGNTCEDSIAFLNSLLFDVVAKVNEIPKILIHVGSGDHHYKGHVVPFKEYLNKCGFDCELDVKEYSDHSDVRYYQALLLDRLAEIDSRLKSSFRITNVELVNEQNKFTIKTSANKNAQYAWYVYKDNERIDVKWYTSESVFKYEAKEPGVYYFQAFAKDEEGITISQKTQQYALY